MAKVFTITEGLENLGALKTGGQGSVYKGRRIGEIFTAIKLLPTPVYSESAADKNFIAFQNEVQKLKKVNEEPNPNVVKIISSGITDSGSLPYIEMEFIEGPDLEELLKPPHDPVFIIKEVIKVADHLSCALAHCHKAGVRHGDIKSNNVKYNAGNGNYVLLDFGLSVMSDEQRRTSLRQAGAIEFMAPEQNEGEMLFETDVYSFGVILFELLAGKVPFPLNDKGETARNKVMLAHLESLPPDVLSLRLQSLPHTWSEQKKNEEMQVPDWLTNMMYKCLEKKPADRFVNGTALYKNVREHTVQEISNIASHNDSITVLQQENKRLRREKEQLQQQLSQYVQSPATNRSINEIPLLNKTGASEFYERKPAHNSSLKKPSLQKNIILSIVALLVISAAFYFLMEYRKNGLGLAQQKNTIAEYKVERMKRNNSTDFVQPNEEIRKQLQNAKLFIGSGKMAEAFIIYNSLAKQEDPEAMYEYGKLALQNINLNITCEEAFDLIKKADDKGYIPAKRTLGFLYSFADNKIALEQNSYYNRCTYSKNLLKGSRLLMEAMLKGDTESGRFLNELNTASLK